MGEGIGRKVQGTEFKVGQMRGTGTRVLSNYSPWGTLEREGQGGSYLAKVGEGDSS